MNSKEKNAFRRKKEWKEFSKEFLKENPKCCFCGCSKPTIVHHKYLEDYTLLEKDRFLPFCNADHRMCHRIAQKKGLSPFILKMKDLLKELDFGEWIKP